MRRLMLLAALACLLPACSSEPRPRAVRIEAAGLKFSNGDESRRAFGKDMRDLLLQGRFDTLDEIADSLRASRARSTDGTWMLRRFYSYGFSEDYRAPWTEEQWTQVLRQLRVWRETHPRSITAPVALGYGLVGYAWHARSSRSAVTVGKKAWQTFGERLSEARLALMEARRLPDLCPAWYTVEQQVALGQGWERAEYDSLYEEAIARTPDFEGYYNAKAHFLLPRWYGKPGEWEVFATETAARFPDSLGSMVYARVVWSQSEYYDNVFDDATVSWPRVKQGMRMIEEDFPESIEIRSAFAYLACLAGDRAEARRLFDLLGKNLDLGVWKDDQRFLRARAWARQVYS